MFEKIVSEYKEKDELYRPSSFWEKDSHIILSRIEEKGMQEFRNDYLMSRFFVPKYGIPTNSFDQEKVSKITAYLNDEGSKKQQLAMDDFLSGNFHALSDYRVLIASDRKDMLPNLIDFSESTFGSPEEQYEFGEKKYSRSSLNYLLGLSFLKNHLSAQDEIKTVVEIGGGFGTLGEILSFTDDTKYIDIDIFPTSYVAHQYLESVYGEEDINKYDEKIDGDIEVSNLPRCSVFHSWQIEQLVGSIDLFVNFISFQEMEPHIVKNYLDKIGDLKPKWILLRNIREGKRVKKGKDEHGVLIPIKTEDYVKMLEENYELIDSNVFPFGYKTVDGFHSELTLYKRK